MLNFLSLGSGSCGNCYYLENDEDALIIDAGIGIRRFKRSVCDYGIKTSKIRGILVTHDHADHIKATGVMSKEYGLKVYTTRDIHEGINRNYQMKNKIDASFRIDINTDEEFTLSSFVITPFHLPHDASDNMGYHIKTNGETFTLMTDVGTVTDNVKKYISLTKYLVLESNYDLDMLRVGRYPEMLKDRIMCGTGHLSNKESAVALAENMSEELKHVWLCHLSEENNHPELAKKTFEMILGNYGIKANKDINLDVLRRKIPTGPFILG